MSEKVKETTTMARIAGVKVFQALDLVDACADCISNPSVRTVQKTVKHVKKVAGR